MSDNRQESILATGFALFSVLTSFVFIFYGVGVLGAESASPWLTAFAYLTAGYGLANIYLLSWAWRARVAWTEAASRLFALCYLGILIVDTVRAGSVTGTKLAVLVAVAAVLWINWLAVKKLIRRPV